MSDNPFNSFDYHIKTQEEEIVSLRAKLATARKDALEEAAREAEDCDHPWVEAREAEHEAAALMAGRIAAAIRALAKEETDE
jgi:hypothetical protein